MANMVVLVGCQDGHLARASPSLSHRFRLLMLLPNGCTCSLLYFCSLECQNFRIHNFYNHVPSIFNMPEVLRCERPGFYSALEQGQEEGEESAGSLGGYTSGTSLASP